MAWALCKAGYHVTYPNRQVREASHGYSKLWRPDLTCLNGNEHNAGHLLIDFVTTAETATTRVAAASRLPRAAAAIAEASKRNLYGRLDPHKLLPFAVEMGGALGEAAMTLLHKCCENAEGLITDPADIESTTHATRRFKNYIFQWLSVCSVRGIGNFFNRAAAACRAGRDNISRGDEAFANFPQFAGR